MDDHYDNVQGKSGVMSSPTNNVCNGISHNKYVRD